MFYDPLTSSVSGSIFGFARTDLIGFADLTQAAVSATASGTTATTVGITGLDHGQNVSFSLALEGSYSASSFSLHADSTGGTILLTNHG